MFNNKRIIIWAVIAFAVFIYANVSQKETQAQESLLVPDTASSGGGGNVKGREILALLADMKKIKLDESIFSDPAFQSLQDLSIELVPEPKGRPNPFAPLGRDALINDGDGTATTSPREISFSSGDTISAN
jgi:hypothetical protein